MMYKKYLVFLLIMVGSLLASQGYAQIPDPGCDPLDPACPIDGGLTLLIAAGVAIGAKKAHQAKKSKQIA